MNAHTKNQQLFEKFVKKCANLLPGLSLLFLSGALLITGTSAWAQETKPEAARPVAVAQSPATEHLMQTTLGLLFLLALLAVLFWMLKRTTTGTAQRRGGFYKVLATSALGPREKIVLIEIGDTWLVLGMTSNSINKLHSMPAGSIELNPKQQPSVDFAKILERLKTSKIKP